MVDNALLFVEAFNRGDAEAIGSLFVEEGEMSLDGVTLAQGRAAIEETYQQFFQENPGAEISVHVETLRQPRPNLIIESGVSEIVNGDEDGVADSYTAIHTKQDGKWLTVSADVRQKLIDDSPDWRDQVGGLVGDWEASRNDWRVTTRFEWVADRNFLKREFKVFEGDNQTASGTQVIGWDPIESAITSWSFTSDGGHGRATWQNDGGQWSISSRATAPEGSVMLATNVITFLNDDTFRYQSTKRSAAGVALDDSESILVHRVNSNPPANLNRAE